MCAQALLAVAAARQAPAPPPGESRAPAGSSAQPAAWRDTGKLPATPGDRPPADPGMVKVSIPEARRLARLAAAPMTRAAREAGHAWSRWRRHHQARARLAPVHCCTEAPSGPRMRVPAHAAQASR